MKLIKLMLRFLPCAFTAASMNRIQGGTCTLHIYKTVDALATIVASGYFNDYSDFLNNGDVIIAVDTNVPTIDVLAVTSADGAAVVTTQNGT